MNSRLIYFVSFCVISFSLYLLYGSLYGGKPEGKYSEPTTKMVTVWKARKEINRGDKVSKEDFERVLLEESKAHVIGFSQDEEIPLTFDSLANRDVNKGDWVMPEFISNYRDAGYLDLLATEGMVLFPLTISTKNLIKNYIRPGQLVDVISVSSPRTNLSESMSKISDFKGLKLKTVLNEVKVLFIRQDFENETINLLDQNEFITPHVVAKGELETTVVLEIPPEYIPILSLAQRTMRLEIYKSSDILVHEAEMTDIMDNYRGILELRANRAEQKNNPEVY